MKTNQLLHNIFYKIAFVGALSFTTLQCGSGSGEPEDPNKTKNTQNKNGDENENDKTKDPGNINNSNTGNNSNTNNTNTGNNNNTNNTNTNNTNTGNDNTGSDTSSDSSNDSKNDSNNNGNNETDKIATEWSTLGNEVKGLDLSGCKTDEEAKNKTVDYIKGIKDGKDLIELEAKLKTAGTDKSGLDKTLNAKRTEITNNMLPEMVKEDKDNKIFKSKKSTIKDILKDIEKNSLEADYHAPNKYKEWKKRYKANRAKLETLSKMNPENKDLKLAFNFIRNVVQTYTIIEWDNDQPNPWVLFRGGGFHRKRYHGDLTNMKNGISSTKVETKNLAAAKKLLKNLENAKLDELFIPDRKAIPELINTLKSKIQAFENK